MFRVTYLTQFGNTVGSSACHDRASGNAGNIIIINWLFIYFSGDFYRYGNKLIFATA
jgi:hypothetical protein